MSSRRLHHRFGEPSGATALAGRAPAAIGTPPLLHRLFEERADLRPNAPAVLSRGRDVSYLELEWRANRIARRLAALGVGRESVVAILLPRGPNAYAAILGVLKAGAAYVPLDPCFPPERVDWILGDCAAAALLTNAELAAHAPAYRGAIVRLDADAAAISAESPERPECLAGPRDPCYVIYTSGTTGRPKGVIVEHRSAAHLVVQEGREFRVAPWDRVWQGFSLSFDAAVEEVWLAFRAGAALVPATAEATRAGPDLPRLLEEARVTVLSCVPTLLSTAEGEARTVRLLIFGGEACPPGLVERWARPGRRVVNTYGPTEATVIATFADLLPGRAVTLGRPLPGYSVHLLDERLRPVRRGEVGEICIGGVGVARGYVNLPGPTRERFVPDPFSPPGAEEPRLYRTGDRGRLDPAGNLEFHGRGDAQVKVRGYRVELAEIEEALRRCPGVSAAACALRHDGGVQCLVAWAVPRGNARLDESALRARLRQRLPGYMVPAVIESIGALPRLPSGKIDREALPAPRARGAAPRQPAAGPRTPTEARLRDAWESVFRVAGVGREDHFFLDLGGHSLLAARLVSELRREPAFRRVSVADVYAHPTVAALAEFLDAHRPSPSAASPQPPAPDSDRVLRREARRHFACGAVQGGGLWAVYGVRALRWATPYLVFFLLWTGGTEILPAAIAAAAAGVLAFPALVLLAVAAKWILLGRVRPGHYPLWGWQYRRWWLVQGLVTALHLRDLGGTPLLPFVLRLFGVRVGGDVHIRTDQIAAFDLVSIGDGATVDEHASLLGDEVDRGRLVIAPVSVGRDGFVGTRSVLSPGSSMEDGARLEDLSMLPAGARVPAGETWAGSPARRAPGPAVRPAPRPAHRPVRRAATAALYTVLVGFLPLLLVLPFIPGVALLTQIGLLERPLLFLAATPLAGASFVLLLAGTVVALKWLLVGRVRPGTYPVHGGFYLRNWVVDWLLSASLDHMGQIHATLHVLPWYRALGARLGRFVELSTASSTTPDLLRVDEGGTVADEVTLGAARLEGGWMTVAPTRIGRRAFLGNSAVVSCGTEIGDGSLVGVLSVPPSRAEAALPGAAWLGSPPIRLPRREPSAAFPETRTYCPPRRLRLARGSFELLRVCLPPAALVFVASVTVTAFLQIHGAVGLPIAILTLPFSYAAACMAVALAVVALKWLLMGRYRPFVRPLWTPFVWRLELVNALYEFLLSPLALDPLQGTPFLPWYLRLLGTRIGRRVYLHTTGFLEWDLVEIGDRAALNDGCVVQTHLFEDRVLKASGLRIGSCSTVGAWSVVLYDSVLEDGSRLDALSLAMKGERLPAGTRWTGVPAAWGGRGAPQPRRPEAATEVPEDAVAR